MISTVSRIAAGRVSARGVCRVGATRYMTIGDQLKSKKKVEEDRYIKAQEAARAQLLHDKKEAEEAVAAATAAEDEYNNEIVPVMDEVAEMLEITGDSVSPEALEVLAKWKLGK